ncbi:MAG: hypothetical protein ISN28_10015 [Ectothiorhodospiraceae bacterium AqS1]|nr:hypothetical protein [Ectothiorhodospiraceae bacterium AqS1]
MLGISLPAKAWQVTRYALMIGEQSAALVSWKAGKFEKLCEYVNDGQGVADFEVYLKDHRKTFQGKSMMVCVSVVGEDYRYEKVAHLIGKYRSDMLKRKFQQLFRGSTFQMAIHQGREPIGRRQDLFLFCGVLSNDKVQPWIRSITKFGGNLSGVHLGSLMTDSIMKGLSSDRSGVQVMTFTTKGGNLRHCFYIDGLLRFSRQSKYNENAPVENVFNNIRAEIDKTCSYLASIKLMQGNAKVNAHVVAPDDLVLPLNELVAQQGEDRIAIKAVSAREIGTQLGIVTPVEEFGRDYSLFLHEMLRSIRFSQMAPVTQIRFYAIKTALQAATAAVVLWGAWSIMGIGYQAATAYGNLAEQNGELAQSIARLKENYDDQVRSFGTPPSTTENMRAAVNVLDNIAGDTQGGGPGRMMLYVSKVLARYPSLQVSNMRWYLSNAQDSFTGELSFANGQRLYEVIELQGVLDPGNDAKAAVNEYKGFISSVTSRADMAVSEQDAPALLEANRELEITLEGRQDIRGVLNRLENDRINVVIAWQPDFLESQGGEGEE